MCSLWDIRLAVLVKPEYKPYISRVQRASVRTGIANALGRYKLGWDNYRNDPKFSDR